ncbi:MAG: hypothetical protein WC456_04835 [Patescibacteria group bacterium]
MFNILWGTLLFLAPFLLIFCFSDRFRGFLYVLSADIAFHLLLALATQAWHIFSYPIILSAHILAAGAVVIILIKKAKKISWRIKINWFALLAFSLIIFELGSVHYFYSGRVSTSTGYQTVTRARHIYPYFSDEWAGVAFVNDSIANRSLPIVNPLIDSADHKSFPNIFLAFFSILAEVFLLLSLPPLIGYPTLAIAAGVLICLLVYILLRKAKISPAAATVSILCLPYITNGQNLAGLWYLLPFIGGLIPFLVSLASISGRDRFLAAASGVLALLIYPPLVIFILPVFLFNLWTDQELKTIAKWQFVLYGLVALLGSGLAVIAPQRSNFGPLSDLLRSYLLYPSLDGGVPSFAIWNIIPWVILPFALIGVFELGRKKIFPILIPVLIGLSFWLIYSRGTQFLVIGYDRVVVITSIFLIASAAAAWDQMAVILIRRFPGLARPEIGWQLKFFILALCLLFSWSYTQRSAWEKLTLTVGSPEEKMIVRPLAPATVFFTAADQRLFSSLPRTRFLSNDWKGLVIGAATGLYPLNTKDSIVTNKILDYPSFGGFSCAEKKISAQEHRLRYVYSPSFDCPGFIKLGSSDENLYLYEFKP